MMRRPLLLAAVALLLCLGAVSALPMSAVRVGVVSPPAPVASSTGVAPAPAPAPTSSTGVAPAPAPISSSAGPSSTGSAPSPSPISSSAGPAPSPVPAAFQSAQFQAAFANKDDYDKFISYVQNASPPLDVSENGLQSYWTSYAQYRLPSALAAGRAAITAWFAAQSSTAGPNPAPVSSSTGPSPSPASSSSAPVPPTPTSSSSTGPVPPTPTPSSSSSTGPVPPTPTPSSSSSSTGPSPPTPVQIPAAYLYQPFNDAMGDDYFAFKHFVTQDPARPAVSANETTVLVYFNDYAVKNLSPKRHIDAGAALLAYYLQPSSSSSTGPAPNPTPSSSTGPSPAPQPAVPEAFNSEAFKNALGANFSSFQQHLAMAPIAQPYDEASVKAYFDNWAASEKLSAETTKAADSAIESYYAGGNSGGGDGGGLSKGAIIGIAVGASVAGLIALIALIACCCKKKKVGYDPSVQRGLLDDE